MLIREATDEELDVVTDLRLRFLAEHRGVEPTQFADGFRTTTREFLRRHNELRTSRSWLADQDGAAVGVVSMLLLDLAPRPEDASSREGYLINLFVDPAHRRRGIGRDLLGAALSAAEQLGLRRLLLHATDDGKPLYEAAGFVPNAKWMELPL